MCYCALKAVKVNLPRRKNNRCERETKPVWWSEPLCCKLSGVLKVHSLFDTFSESPGNMGIWITIACHCWTCEVIKSGHLWAPGVFNFYRGHSNSQTHYLPFTVLYSRCVCTEQVQAHTADLQCLLYLPKDSKYGVKLRKARNVTLVNSATPLKTAGT